MPGIKYIAAGFVQDAEKLLTEFVRENSPEFSVFVHFWKKHNFAGVFLGRSSAELQQFTHEIFQLTLKFLVTADLYHQIGAIYLLYALFRNQIVEPPTRIRIVLQQYEHFLELRRLAMKERYKALHYVIGYLMEHGFDYIAHPTLVGPRNSKHNMEIEKKALQMACMLKDLKDHSMSLFESNSLEEIQELNKAYTELTKSIPFKNNVFQEENDFNMETQFKNLSRLIGAGKNDSEAYSQNEKAYDSIGSRRAQIKSNAFASKAWFRQLNPTDDDEDEGIDRFTRSRAQRKSLSRKAKLSKETEEDEESDDKVVKPKRRVKRVRLPKGKRRIGRPRKDQELEELLIEVGDIPE
ncbi:snRNA-activating protein complex subunit 1, partial [Araneus ventricosus]